MFEGHHDTVAGQLVQSAGAAVTMVKQVAQPRWDDWVRFALGLIVAALVAYFTAQGQTDKAITALNERESNHFSEVLRRLGSIDDNISELRRGAR